MAFYDWSKNVPTSLPTLGGTQPQRSTWSTPTQKGVQASLPSTKLQWSVAEEEDEEELRKKVAALPWNQPAAQPKKEVPSSGYVHQTKEEIQRKYGFTPTTQTGGNLAQKAGQSLLTGATEAAFGVQNFVNEIPRFINMGINTVARWLGADQNILGEKSFTEAVGDVVGSKKVTQGLELASGVTSIRQQQNQLQDVMQGANTGEQLLSSVLRNVSLLSVSSGLGRLASTATQAATAGQALASITRAQKLASSVDMPTVSRTLGIIGSNLASLSEESDSKQIGYQWTSALTEGATELMFGVFDELPALMKLGRKAFPTAGAMLSTYLRGAVGEGVEEALQYVAQTGIDYLYYNDGKRYSDMFDIKQLGMNALAGAIGSFVFTTYGTVRARGSMSPETKATYDILARHYLNKPLEQVTVDDMDFLAQIAKDAVTENEVDIEISAKKFEAAKRGETWTPPTQPQPEIVTPVTEPIVSAVDATTSDLGAEQASVTTPTAETPTSASREATAPSINLSEASVISSGTSTGDVYKIGNKVYKKTTYRATGNKTLEAEVYSSLSEISEIATANFVNINGEQYIETPYFPIVVSVDTVPKDKRTRYQRAIAQNTTRITAAVEALSNAGYKYNDPLQFGYDSDGNFYLMDFSNASKETGELYDDSAIEENYGRLADFYNAFGLERLAKIVSTSIKFKSVLEDSTVQEVEDREVLLSDEDYEVARQLKRSGGEISPNNAYYATNGRFIAIDGIAQSEPVDGTKYVYSEVQIAPSAVREWEITPIYEKKEIKNPKEAPISEPKPITTPRTEQRAPVQEKARVSIKKETVSGRDRLSAKFDRSVSGVEKDILAASGVKYDAKTDSYYTGTDLTSRKLFESAIESLDVENLDEVIDSVNEMFEEPTGGIFSSKKGTLDLGAKNDAKTGYAGIENEEVADRIEKASFFVPQQKQGKGFLGELVESWQRFTRGGIDIDRRYGDIRAAIFRLRNSRGAAATAIKMTLLKTVNKLSQDQYKLLSHAFVFRDMIEDISLGTVNMNDLPFGYGSDIDGLLKQAQSIEQLLKDPKNKVVADTIKAMQDAMDVMRQRVIKGAAKVGGDLSFLNSRKEYMTHAVIEYIEEIKKTGKRTAEKFYQRYGTNKDYITDPTIAYFIAMQKLYRMDAKNNLMFQVQKHDVAKDFVIKSGDDAGTLGEIPDGYSILNKETLGIKIEKTAQKTAFEEKIKSRRSLWDTRIAETKADLQAQILNGATEAEQERLNKRIAQMERTRDHDDAMLKEQLGKMEHENYVLPSEIVEAIQEEYKHDIKKEMLIGRVGKAMTGLFKRNALVNPTQLVKYNIKNMFGDFEAMLATYPEGIKKVPQAVNELWDGLVLNKQTKFFEEWVRAGQMDSGLMSTSLEELNNSTRVLYDKAALNNKQSAAKVASKFANVWHKYWEGASSVTSFREQILRYATALAVYEEIQNDIKRGGRGLPRLLGTKLANYGASVPVEVLSITDMFERTLLLSNQAIGNYQDVSKLMQTLSKYAIPFGRWLEVNPMRWGRIIKNTMTTDSDVVMEKGEQAISTFAKGAKVGAFTVMKIGKVALSVAMFNLFLLLWNRVFFKDDDDKLPKSIKEQSHITLGTFPGTDKVMYFQDLSSFGQFSEMFGLNGKIPFYSDIKRVVNGETTFENFVKESVAQAGGIWVNSFTPFAKTPVEAYLVKGSLFPDPSSPRPIYDVAEHFFAAADLKNVYRTIKGLPVKGGSYLTELSSALVNSVEAGDAATWDMYSIREDYLKSIGEYKKPTRYEKDAKALAIYYFKQALRYGDNDAAVEYLAKYVQAGGTKKTYNASMNTLDPLFGLKKEQKTGILEWMNEEQKATYERAVQNFEELKEIGKEYWD